MMSKMTVLNGEDIESLLTVPMAIDAVEQAYLEKSRGQASTWPIVCHDFITGEADLDIKSGNLDGLGFYGLKVVSWFGANPDKGLPALYGTSLLFDLKTGAPKALLNAGPITHFRTGAAGAIGAKYLARPDSKVLTMAGSGALAPYLIACTLYLMPQIEQVCLVNPHNAAQKAASVLPAVTEEVKKLLSDSGKALTAKIEASDIETAVKASDIILTATPAREPFLRAEWVRPGTHISCVGADMSGKQEIESKIFRTAKAFADDEAQCLSVGECEIPHKDGSLSAIAAEIGDVIAGTKPGRTGADEITVFDSTGIALQDIASAAALLNAAEKSGRGSRIEL
mgnify:CR=1 FL=1